MPAFIALGLGIYLAYGARQAFAPLLRLRSNASARVTLPGHAEHRAKR